MMNPEEFANIANSEERFWWYRGMRHIMFRLLDPIAARYENVLEAGCGTGYFSRVLEQRYGWRMFPLDLGYEGLEYARRYGLRRLTQGDIQALPYRAGSFDALLSMDVVVHIPRGEERRPFREFHRVLRPGGLLAVRVAALDVLKSRHSEFVRERQRFTRGRLRQAVEAADFRVIRCTYANSLLMPVSLVKFRLWEPLTSRAPSSGVQPLPPWLDQALGLPLTIEAAAIGAGVDFPVGQSLIVLAERR
ncbi:MAG: methyltransferase domain-containing protein [Bryobacterales bacterium]|nr:methyltransferase domain-containing protein [Bryobacterales bacterium]